MPTVLYVTDLTYQAKGRRYCDEDIALSAALRGEFATVLCHPLDAAALMGRFDLTVVRNSGPVLGYREAHEAFRERALAEGVKVFNPLHGRGDMAGKGYLLDLTAAGYPVIPTVASADGLGRLPEAAVYLSKPLLGADSIGMALHRPEELPSLELDGTVLLQPRIDFRYEVSFYYVGREFQYALYAPDPAARWRLERYDPTPSDLAFARRFVEWNALDHGIQRVDACRTPEGGLLLVELEDLNPYLSLDLLDGGTRASFTAAMAASMRSLLES
ncbi:hypothetical protein ACIA8O_18770 [Kitasatospora sp. NPDC051853]|uniref:hypothetical protein n=1 Tax=Kitasatospora sp. NPDC051853 TaxID=3364058 RepID=UPI00378DB407